MSKLIKRIIELAFKLNVIGTNFKNPIRFKSGIMSPIYCDWRKCSESPELMNLICEAFEKKIASQKFDVIMGVAAGAVPHSERLAEKLNLPSAYVRPGAKVKDYGLEKLIEGASVDGKNIFLIEDLYSTGGSALENRKIVLKAGATEVEMCSIFSYNMETLYEEFQKEGLQPDSLMTIHNIIPYLLEILNTEEYEMLTDWVKDPIGWFDRHKRRFNFGYLTILRQATVVSNSIISMGLDPIVESLPREYRNYKIEGFAHFFENLGSEMWKFGIMPASFKPNESCYIAHNEPRENNYEGNHCLSKVMSTCEKIDTSVILDCKRGDIGTTSGMYAKAYFEKWVPDAITVHPYMGDDSVLPFAKYCNNDDAKGVYILDLTSNKGSENFQKKMMATGKFLHEEVAQKIIEWANKRPGVGAVVGATHLEQLAGVLKAFAGKDIPVLVPGVGAQGGSAKDVADIAREVGFELELLRINSSSGLTHPWYKKPGDAIPSERKAIEMCINELKTLNEETGFTGTCVSV